MFTKYFYLVRHGQTILNQEKKRQDDKGGLSDTGKKEVEDLGERLTHMNIKKMFVSPFERTRETASIVNKYLKLKDKDIIFTDLLAERRNPTLIVGKSYEDPIAKSFVDTMDKSIHDPNLRLYDEENFQDLKERAIEAQRFLKNNSVKRNLCITHGIFLKMFLSTLLYGKDLQVRDYIEMNLYNPADNAGVTLVKYNPVKNFMRPLYKFFDSIFKNEDKNENVEDYDPKRMVLDKYSPWEILAYNDYNRDGFKRLHI